MNKQILYLLSIDKKSAMTLVELLISIALMGMLVLGISSLGTYAKFHLVGQDRGMVAQNESAYLMEHIAKNITGWGTRGGAIGNVNLPAVVIDTAGPNLKSIGIKVDGNANGRWDAGDRVVGYRFGGQNFLYCDNCVDADDNCKGCAGTVISTKKRIETLTFTFNPNQNFLDITLTTCWDTGATDPCGRPGNPSSTLSARIKMPSTSSN